MQRTTRTPLARVQASVRLASLALPVALAAAGLRAQDTGHDGLAEAARRLVTPQTGWRARNQAARTLLAAARARGGLPEAATGPLVRSLDVRREEEAPWNSAVGLGGGAVGRNEALSAYHEALYPPAHEVARRPPTFAGSLPYRRPILDADDLVVPHGARTLALAILEAAAPALSPTERTSLAERLLDGRLGLDADEDAQAARCAWALAPEALRARVVTEADVLGLASSGRAARDAMMRGSRTSGPDPRAAVLDWLASWGPAEEHAARRADVLDALVAGDADPGFGFLIDARREPERIEALAQAVRGAGDAALHGKLLRALEAAGAWRTGGPGRRAPLPAAAREALAADFRTRPHPAAARILWAACEGEDLEVRRATRNLFLELLGAERVDAPTPEDRCKSLVVHVTARPGAAPESAATRLVLEALLGIARTTTGADPEEPRGAFPAPLAFDGATAAVLKRACRSTDRVERVAGLLAAAEIGPAARSLEPWTQVSTNWIFGDSALARIGELTRERFAWTDDARAEAIARLREAGTGVTLREAAREIARRDHVVVQYARVPLATDVGRILRELALDEDRGLAATALDLLPVPDTLYPDELNRRFAELAPEKLYLLPLPARFLLEHLGPADELAARPDLDWQQLRLLRELASALAVEDPDGSATRVRVREFLDTLARDAADPSAREVAVRALCGAERWGPSALALVESWLDECGEDDEALARAARIRMGFVDQRRRPRPR